MFRHDIVIVPKEEIFRFVEIAVSRMPDDPNERLSPPVVEPLEGHPREIIHKQHGSGRRTAGRQ